jgi:putative Holliday junction resolvase
VGAADPACYNAFVRAIGLDVGSKTIGVAVSDEGRLVATAREVIRRAGQQADARAVVQRVRDESATTLVIGWPLELDGREGRRARRVAVFIEALRTSLDAAGLVGSADDEGRRRPVEMIRWDERFSTAAAERTLLEADVSRAKRKQSIDAVAAQHILQGWLDAERSRAEEAS